MLAHEIFRRRYLVLVLLRRGLRQHDRRRRKHRAECARTHNEITTTATAWNFHFRSPPPPIPSQSMRVAWLIAQPDKSRVLSPDPRLPLNDGAHCAPVRHHRAGCPRKKRTPTDVLSPDVIRSCSG